MDLNQAIADLVDELYDREASGSHEENLDVVRDRFNAMMANYPVHTFIAIIKKAGRCGA